MLHVLLVDDDTMVTYFHQIMVKESKLSADPFCALNGQLALEYIIENSKNRDFHFLVLLDINMPIMNGWEFMEAIQSAPFSDRIMVVMVTSSTDSNDRKKAEQYPQLAGYYEKPVNETICLALKQHEMIANFFA